MLSVLAYFLVFLSGAAAMVYEVIWQRYLARLIGNDSMATALILGVFLGGLACGYWLCGRLSMRVRNPFRAYAVLEALIGLWGLSFPWLFAAIDGLGASLSFEPPWWMLLQGISASILLIGVPTLCMGGTIPLLTQGLSQSLEHATSVQARTYGANNAGAFVGVIAAGLVLVPQMGLPASLQAAAAINFVAALFFAWWPAPLATPVAEEAAIAAPISPPDRRSGGRFAPSTLYAIAFLSGAAAISLENVLIRITSLTFGPSTFSFSLIVGVFVLCLSVGSLAIGALRQLPRWLLFGVQACGLLAWALVFLSLDTWPYFARLLRLGFGHNVVAFWFHKAAVLSSLIAILALPVATMGGVLPILFHELKEERGHLGLHAGRLLAWNACGCVLGSLIGGWLLYYVLDNPGVLAVSFCLMAAAMLLAAGPLGKAPRVGAVVVATATITLVAWPSVFDKHRFAYGTFNVRGNVPFSLPGVRAFFDDGFATTDVLFYDDGAAGTVAVLADAVVAEVEGPPGLPLPPEVGETAEDPSLGIVVNGKPDSNTSGDRQTLKLSAHLPAIWARQRARALVIGLGTGVTAGELALYPDVQTIAAAEISPSVIEALPYFAAFTHRIHEDARFRLHQGDAFRILRRNPEKWDLIIAEPSNPWVNGVDQLFSREFYQLVRQRLTEEGALLQWVQKYAIDAELFGILLNTLRSEFRHCYVYEGEPGDLLILARMQPLTEADRDRAQSAFEGNAAVRQSLAEIGIGSFEELRQRERMGLMSLADQMAQFGVETLDRPRIHDLAGKTQFSGVGLGDAPTALPEGGPFTILSQSLIDRPMQFRLQADPQPGSGSSR